MRLETITERIENAKAKIERKRNTIQERSPTGEESKWKSELKDSRY